MRILYSMYIATRYLELDSLWLVLGYKSSLCDQFVFSSPAITHNQVWV